MVESAKSLPELVYGPMEIEPGPDYTQPSGMEPIVAQLGIEHHPRRRTIATLETKSGKQLPVEQTRTSQVVVVLNTQTGKLSHQEFKPSTQIPAFSDLAIMSRVVYQNQQDQLLNQPDTTKVRRKLETALKKGTTRPVVFPKHNPQHRILKPSSSFRYQGGNKLAKIPKTGGFGLKR